MVTPAHHPVKQAAWPRRVENAEEWHREADGEVFGGRYRDNARQLYLGAA